MYAPCVRSTVGQRNRLDPPVSGTGVPAWSPCPPDRKIRRFQASLPIGTPAPPAGCRRGRAPPTSGGTSTQGSASSLATSRTTSSPVRSSQTVDRAVASVGECGFQAIAHQLVDDQPKRHRGFNMAAQRLHLTSMPTVPSAPRCGDRRTTGTVVRPGTVTSIRARSPVRASCSWIRPSTSKRSWMTDRRSSALPWVRADFSSAMTPQIPCRLFLTR